jgi:hypothetical protein
VTFSDKWRVFSQSYLAQGAARKGIPYRAADTSTVRQVFE